MSDWTGYGERQKADAQVLSDSKTGNKTDNEIHLTENAQYFEEIANYV